MSENTLFLELTEPRALSLQDRGHQFVLACRRVTKADWLAFFTAGSVTSEQDGNTRVTTSDYESPLLALADRVIVAAEGYKVSGGGSLQDLPHWQTRLPLSHRRTAGALLASARVSAAPAEFFIRPDGEEVSLDAVWTAETTRSHERVRVGAMQKFTGLKHVFETPSAAQHKRFQHESSRSIVVGGSRKGKTIYPMSQALLCELYDELIVSVDGYVVEGAQLAGRSQIVAEMDFHHKFIAAQELFIPHDLTPEGTE